MMLAGWYMGAWTLAIQHTAILGMAFTPLPLR